MSIERHRKILGAVGARAAIREGVRIAAEMVAPTLGPKGKKVFIDREYAKPDILDDGYMILQSIELENADHQMGVKLVREASTQTNDRAGDGTTTTAVLANELVQLIVPQEDQTLLLTNQGGDQRKLRQEISSGIAKLTGFLDACKVPCTDERVKQIAVVSSNSEEIGDIISTIVKRLGNNTGINISESQGITTDYEVVEGMQLDTGFLSPAFVTDGVRQEAVVQNARVLVTDLKVQDPKHAELLYKLFKEHGVNDLVIFADDVDGVPLKMLVGNKMLGNIRVLAVRSPRLGNASELLEDIAILTGAKFISKENGGTLDSITADVLGAADKVVCTIDSTTIVGGKGEKAAIDERVKLIEHTIEGKASKYDQDRLRDRIAKLSSGIAVIKVGGATEIERDEKKAKIDDAIHAVKAALKDGAVAGGGVMLLRAAQILDPNIRGEALLQKALEKPFRLIVENADYDVATVMKSVLENKDVNTGFNVDTGEVCDLVNSGIIDPVMVVKTALENAVSIANIVAAVSGATVVVHKKDKPSTDSVV